MEWIASVQVVFIVRAVVRAVNWKVAVGLPGLPFLDSMVHPMEVDPSILSFPGMIKWNVIRLRTHESTRFQSGVLAIIKATDGEIAKIDVLLAEVTFLIVTKWALAPFHSTNLFKHKFQQPWRHI